ncbi:MAG: hypothetical protein ABJD24_03005 [Acidimicrobiales bacterium]
MRDLNVTARRLASLIEPIVGQVYFSPECHAEYEKLGFDPSPGKAGEVALPDGPAYFTSRGSLMGQVPGEVVAAAFSVFNPAVVVPHVQLGWTRTDAATICAARTRGAVAQLVRILGEHPDGIERAGALLRRAASPLKPEGRPLFAGALASGYPGTPLGDAWHAGDLLREYRGDCHTAAWVTAGVSAVEIGLLTELFWGLPPRSYIRTRAWTEADLDDATAALIAKGYLDATGRELTTEGRAAREAIEEVTDAQMAPAIGALGTDADELFSIIEPWGAAVRTAGGYLASGPHDLARRAGTR